MTSPPAILAELLADCAAGQVVLNVLGDGGLTIDAPRDALTPELLARLKASKPELVTLLLPTPTSDFAWGPDAEFWEVNEFNWSQMKDADRDYALGPRNYPPRCAWCGGRLVHNPLCDELRRSWEPTVPFGKHAGKGLSEVPREYLKRLLRHPNTNRELRDAIRERLTTLRNA